MKKTLVLTAVLALATTAATAGAEPLHVVTSLTDYAAIAREIAGEHAVVESILTGAADPHFLKPKPSYALMLRDADLFVATGLDLELWAPVVVNKSGNRRIVDGGPGYVAAAHGIDLLQKPTSMSRTAGDVHVYGNPHIHTSPINAKIIATNITTGLCKVDPEHCSDYEQGLAAFKERINARLYGDELVELLGADTLDRLTTRGQLLRFLQDQGIDSKLGGWLGKARSLRGRRVVCYHKNWAYFNAVFGLEVAAYVEPKPGLPPTARHVAELVQQIEREGIEVLLSANYFEERKPQLIAERTGIRSVVVPLSVDGEEGVSTYFDLVDLWVDRLTEAFASAEHQEGH
jgi:zinc/manganese transport system substrate-binding protein